MSFAVESIRAEIERVDNIKKAVRALREVIDRVEDVGLRAALHEVASGVEGVALARPGDEKIHSRRKLVIGSDKCGKTALLRRFLLGDFVEQGGAEGLAKYKKQPEDRLEATVTVDGKPIKVAIVHHGSTLGPKAVAWADTVFLVYSVRDVASFEMVYGMYQKVMHYSNDMANVILVGTQADDDQSQRRISWIEGKRLAADLNGCAQFEVSAKTSGERVVHVLMEGIRAARQDAKQSPELRKYFRKYSVSTLRGKQQGSDNLRNTPRPDRGLPVRAGWLLKQSGDTSLRSQWKKRYAVLQGGCLHYYYSVNDYVQDTGGKHIVLKLCSVKTALRPAQRHTAPLQLLRSLSSTSAERTTISRALRQGMELDDSLAYGSEPTMALGQTRSLPFGSQPHQQHTPSGPSSPGCSTFEGPVKPLSPYRTLLHFLPHLTSNPTQFKQALTCAREGTPPTHIHNVCSFN